VRNFSIGEEVIHKNERFIITGTSASAPLRYRLLTTGKQGVRFVWANPNVIEKIKSYTSAVEDTKWL
jgi:hypothetical protein